MEQRTISLIGEDAYQRLKESHVAVFGVGGVGCYCIEALARAGVGRLTLIDCDIYDETNLNRQLYALRSTLGKGKAAVAAERIGDINPECIVTALNERVCAGNIADILSEKIDFVCDAIDDIPAKVAIAKFCGEKNLPQIACMGAGNRIGTGGFVVTDIFKTSYDPLAKAMRKRLRDAGITALDVCISSEQPFVSGRQTPSSISYVPAMAGLAMVGHVIRKLAGL